MAAINGAKIRKEFSRSKQRLKRFVQHLHGKEYVHFLHIRKTGGTAVKHALENHTESSDRYLICLHSHSVRLSDVAKGQKVFFFLRDPISRFISGFYSRQRQGKPRRHNPWNAGEQEAFTAFATPNLLAEALSAADADLREAAERAMTSIRHVNSSYWDWFENEEYFRSRAADIMFVGFQESLAEDFETLISRLGLPSDLSLPADEAQAHKNPANLDKSLSELAVDNLKRWYERDYQFLDLCKRI